MEEFDAYLASAEPADHRTRVHDILTWISETFPSLDPVVKWNQPMFTLDGTFIIGLSVAKKHLAVAPEPAGIEHFADQIVAAGYDYTSNLMRIGWNNDVDFDLLEEMIAFNMAEKAGCETFWRGKTP